MWRESPDCTWGFLKELSHLRIKCSLISAQYQVLLCYLLSELDKKALPSSEAFCWMEKGMKNIHLLWICIIHNKIEKKIKKSRTQKQTEEHMRALSLSLWPRPGPVNNLLHAGSLMAFFQRIFSLTLERNKKNISILILESVLLSFKLNSILLWRF